MYNKNGYKRRTQPIVITRHDSSTAGEAGSVKLNLTSGITPDIVCASVKSLMKHMGAGFYELTGDDLARRVNIITSCSKMNDRRRSAPRALALA